MSKLHPSDDDDDDADGNDDFRSAPGAALPENGLVRLFISERERERNRKKKNSSRCSNTQERKENGSVHIPDINSIILRLAPQAVIPISQRSFSVKEGNVAMSTS